MQIQVNILCILVFLLKRNNSLIPRLPETFCPLNVSCKEYIQCQRRQEIIVQIATSLCKMVHCRNDDRESECKVVYRSDGLVVNRKHIAQPCPNLARSLVIAQVSSFMGVIRMGYQGTRFTVSRDFCLPNYVTRSHLMPRIVRINGCFVVNSHLSQLSKRHAVSLAY